MSHNELNSWNIVNAWLDGISAWAKPNEMLKETLQSVNNLAFFFNVYFWERKRATEHEWGGGAENEGNTESKAGSGLWAVSTEPSVGLELTDYEIMTWAQVECLTDQATQAPLHTFFFNMKFIVKLVSIQHPVLIPTGALLNVHHPLSPPSHPPSTLSLFSVFKSLLWFASLSVTSPPPLPHALLLSFSGST